MTRSSIVVPVTSLFLMLMLEPDQAEAQCDGVDIQVDSKHQCVKLKDPFRDCPKCPELVVAPSGTFMMGSPKDEPQREPSTNPPFKYVSMADQAA